MTKAEERALEAYPIEICGYVTECKIGAKPQPQDWNEERRKCFQEGYEAAEKDMKERFIQFVHRHYPINYIGWIQDFQKAMEDEK